MSSIVFLRLGRGTVSTGFPDVEVRLTTNHQTIAQCSGCLPPATDLEQQLQTWQFLHESFYKHRRYCIRGTIEGIEVETTGITSFSEVEFRQVAADLKFEMQRWLNADGMRGINHLLRIKLNEQDSIPVVIETQDAHLYRLPWHCWQLFQDFRAAEPIFSAVNFQRPHVRSQRHRPRILFVLGNLVKSNYSDINIPDDKAQIYQLDIDVISLTKPRLKELCESLCDPLGWDIFYFAGHSNSHTGGQFYLDDKTAVSISDIAFSIQTAISNGLKLAIFNSCDGSALARDLAELNIPTTIVMTEPVPNFVAQEFLKAFLENFSRGIPLFQAVRVSRESLEGLEQEFPCASWLPTIWQNLTVEPLVWQRAGVETSRRQPRRLKFRSLLVIVLMVMCTVMSLRSLGWLEGAELWVYDRLTQWQPNLGLNAKILIVGVTDADAQTFGKPISDQAVYEVLTKLEQAEAKVIGLDILRDQPTEPGWKELTQFLQQSKQTIVPCTVGEVNGEVPASPPGISVNQTGYIDSLMEDPDGYIRRYVLRMPLRPQSSCQTTDSFGLRVLSHYLDAEVEYIERDQLLVLRTSTRPTVEIPTLSGGSYVRPAIQMTAHQVLIPYQIQVSDWLSLTDIKKISIAELRHRVGGKVVLIGYVGERTSKDIHLTPMGKLPGVIIHAQVVHQLLRHITESRPLLTSFSASETFGWILLWAIGVSFLQLYWGQNKQQLILVSASLLLFVIGITWFTLIAVWLPIVPTVLALLGNSLLISLWLNRKALIEKGRLKWHSFLSQKLR